MSTRKWRTSGTILAALLTAIAACGVGQPAGTGIATTQSPAAQAHLKLGFTAGFSGNVAFYGQNARKGMELAISEINAGSSGLQLELLTADDECSPQGGVSAYRDLLTNRRVDVLLGSTCSGAVLAGMPILASSKIPGITFTAASPTITQRSGVGGNQYSWRMNLDDSIMGETVAALIASSGVTSVALLSPDNDFGRSAVDVYGKALPQQKVSLVSTQYYTINAGDYRPQLTKIQASGAGGIFILGNAPDCAVTLRQMNELGLKLKVFSRAGCASPEALTALGAQTSLANGVLEATYWAPSPSQSKFIDSYKAKHGIEPEYLAGLGYYAIMVVVEAIKASGKPNAAGIQEGLAKLDWKSPIGPIKFDQNNQAHPNLFILTVESGQVKLLKELPTE